jgi:hypothetical protein
VSDPATARADRSIEPVMSQLVLGLMTVMST